MPNSTPRHSSASGVPAFAAWVARRAATGRAPLRIVFEAQLGFQGWRTRRQAGGRGLPAPRSAGAATPPASASSRATQREERLAQRLAQATVLLAVLSLSAVGNHDRTGGVPLVVDRLASGAPARFSAFGPSRPPATLPTLSAEVAAAAPPPPAIPARRGALPVGKGMWIWQTERVDGGNVDAVVARAKAAGLSHLYVRTGTLREGFVGADYLNRLLPRAHAAGLRVYAWDFPYLRNVHGDVDRALKAITHVTPDGHRVDGYAADIELQSMGVNITPQTASLFGSVLRKAVGANYPLVAVVPRPSSMLTRYPFAEVVASFDAVAPMVYWLGRDPARDVIGAIEALRRFGKPIVPVGQAYDGRAEGGPPGVPPRGELLRFSEAAEAAGAVGVSWWSWQHADQQAWDAIRDAPQFRLPVQAEVGPSELRAYQALLTSIGFPAPLTGALDDGTRAALAAYQEAARLPVTGSLDASTRAILLTPFGPPLQPQ